MLIKMINRWLRGQSPARRAALIECNRRIGEARYHARRAMVRAAIVEHESGELDRAVTFLKGRAPIFIGADTGPGYLPAIVWRTLPYVALRNALKVTA